MKVGATLEDLDRLANEFRQQSAAARQLRSSISGQLSSTDWIGEAANRFRGEWDGRYAPMLASLGDELEQLGGYVARKRTELEQANR